MIVTPMPPKPTQISDLEQEYYTLKSEWQKAIDKVNKKYSDRVLSLKARLAVSGKCSHQSVREYDWEHDNGYGRQRWCKGLECNICGLRNSYPDSSTNWHNPKDNH